MTKGEGFYLLFIRTQALRADNIYYFAIVTGTIFVETSVTAVW